MATDPVRAAARRQSHLEDAAHDGALPPLDQLAFRRVMGHFASGVTVITCRRDGANYGMTANAFTSLSLEPPMVVVCLFQGARTRSVVTECGRFAVNILREDQGHLAELFASRAPDRFDGVEISYGETGLPLLAGALAHVECRVVNEVPGGTHSIFVGEALHAVADEGLPLGYFRGAFGYFLAGDDAAVYAALRESILDHRLVAGTAFELAGLAAELDAEPAAVHTALGRLVRERLIVRDETGAYSVAGVDARTVEEIMHMRRIVEVGAAEATVGIIPRAELDEWEDLARLPCPAHPASRGDRVRPECDFHERMIGFTRNERLVDHYRALSIDHFPVGAVVSPRSVPELERDHLAMVDGYRRGDLSAVGIAIRRHARRLRNAWLDAGGLRP